MACIQYLLCLGCLLRQTHSFQVLEKPVLLSPDEQAAGDPRNRPEAGELEPEQAPVLLPVPLFALGPPEAAVAPGGGWEEDSVFSWSESPRRAGLTEEVDSNPGKYTPLLVPHPRVDIQLAEKFCRFLHGRTCVKEELQYLRDFIEKRDGIR